MLGFNLGLNMIAVFCSQNKKLLADVSVPLGVLTADECEELVSY